MTKHFDKTDYIRSSEEPLTRGIWIDRCQRALTDRLPAWNPVTLHARATALWRIAPCLPPEEAAEILASRWSNTLSRS